jgi:hypothetical protein
VRYTASNVTTAVMLGLTLWLVIGRFKVRGDSNWPLYYWAALIAYHQGFQGHLNQYALYAGVICALLIRFEFVGGWFRILLRGVELGVLLHVVYQLFNVIFVL